MRFREIRREVKEVTEIRNESIFPTFFNEITGANEPGYLQIKPVSMTIAEAKAFWNDLPDQIGEPDEADELPDEIDLEWLERNERRRARC